MQKDWLQLAQLKGLTLPAKRVLVRALGSPGAVLAADRDTLTGILRAAADESMAHEAATGESPAHESTADRRIDGNSTGNRAAVGRQASTGAQN